MQLTSVFLCFTFIFGTNRIRAEGVPNPYSVQPVYEQVCIGSTTSGKTAAGARWQMTVAGQNLPPQSAVNDDKFSVRG